MTHIAITLATLSAIVAAAALAVAINVQRTLARLEGFLRSASSEPEAEADGGDFAGGLMEEALAQDADGGVFEFDFNGRRS